MTIRVLFILFVASFALFTTFRSTRASPGDLDPTFGNAGKVIGEWGGARGVAIQADGRIVVAGFREGIGIDPPDATHLYHFPLLARFNADGSLDTTFDGNGYFSETEVGEYSAVVIQSDGKIVISGNWGEWNGFDVTRFNTDGSRDTSFSNDGVMSIAFNTFFWVNNEVSALALQPDGRLIVVGQTYNGSNIDFAIARIRTFGIPGTLDTTFSGDGKVVFDFNGDNDYARSVAVHPTNGKIVIAGSTGNYVDSDFLVAMLNLDGTLDTSFGPLGKRSTDFYGEDDAANAVAFDGVKVVAAGYSTYSTYNADFSLMRYNANGTLDTNFSGDGKVRIVFGFADDVGNAMRLQADGKIVVAGYTYSSGYSSGPGMFALARFNNNGSADTTFGTSGKTTTDFYTMYNPNDIGRAAAIQADGKIVVVGGEGGYGRFLLARYDP